MKDIFVVSDIQVLDSRNVARNLERETAFHIKKKLHEKISGLEILIRPSPLSQSRYVIVKGIHKGAIVRISDHEKFINPRMSAYYLRHRIQRSFYLFTNTSNAMGRDDYYPLPMIDQLIQDVVSYME